MTTNDRMICAECDAEMNLHAIKIDPTREVDISDSGQNESTEALLEFHTCPRCGATAARDCSE